VTRVLFRADIGEIEGGREHFDEEYSKLGPLESWQSSKVNEGYSRGAYQGHASMKRMGGPDAK
jgi:hypothetical protein